MKVLTIITHPRRQSLTFEVAGQFINGLKTAGHEVDTIDLYRHHFSPILFEEDEPDWKAEKQQYSHSVEKEMKRLNDYEGLAFVFPLWWWSMPAMMKGYIDRVWNYGFAYGGANLQHSHVHWLSLAGAPIERFEKRGYDKMMEHYFNVGLADYCGIKSSTFELLYETNSVTFDSAQDLLSKAYYAGRTYSKRRDEQ